MTTQFIALILLPFLAGITVFLIPRFEKKHFNLILVFSGAYLFSITIIHIIPDIFSHITKDKYEEIALFILIGFFIQLILEFFSEGVEHGHLHPHHHEHSHHSKTAVMLIVALSIHAFLEGTLLAHPHYISPAEHHNSNTIFLGIILHKLPAAFALMSVLVCYFNKKIISISLLLLFCLASPMGFFASQYLSTHQFISDQTFTFLFALVSGSFLHISTTIFFESSPTHRFNFIKLGISILGALLAVFTESLM